MRIRFLAAAVTVAAVVAILAAAQVKTRTPAQQEATSRHHAPKEGARAGSPSSAVTPHPTGTPSAAEGAAAVRDAAPNGPPLRPTSLAEVEMTPQLRKSLEELGLFGSEFVDYRLGFLSRFEKCLDGRTMPRGNARVHFLFDIDLVNPTQAVGTRVTFADTNETTLSPEGQALFLECAGKAHYGQTVRFSQAIPVTDDPNFHWMPFFRLPITDDEYAYVLARTGVITY